MDPPLTARARHWAALARWACAVQARPRPPAPLGTVTAITRLSALTLAVARARQAAAYREAAVALDAAAAWTEDALAAGKPSPKVVALQGAAAMTAIAANLRAEAPR
jgi:hypothetical protein